MLASIRPLMRGALGARSHLSWRRCVFLLACGLAANVGVVGMAALRTQFLGSAFYLPSWLGGSLACAGGMLAGATVLAGRGQEGMSESDALRLVTQAAAMALYVAEPLAALGGLGLTRILRACLPFTVVRVRWRGVLEGVLLLGLCLVPRDAQLGGLRMPVPASLLAAPLEVPAEVPAEARPG